VGVDCHIEQLLSNRYKIKMACITQTIFDIYVDNKFLTMNFNLWWRRWWLSGCRMLWYLYSCRTGA